MKTANCCHCGNFLFGHMGFRKSYIYAFYIKKNLFHALSSVVQLVGASSHKPKGRGFDSDQGTYLGCGFGPQLGSMQEATNRYFSVTQMSLSLLLSLPSSLSKISEHVLGEDEIKRKKILFIKQNRWCGGRKEEEELNVQKHKFMINVNTRNQRQF